MPVKEFIFTPRMHQVLKFVTGFAAKNGRGPSGAEIGAALDTADSACSLLLRRMTGLELLVRRGATSQKNRPMWRYTVSAKGREWL